MAHDGLKMILNLVNRQKNATEGEIKDNWASHLFQINVSNSYLSTVRRG